MTGELKQLTHDVKELAGMPDAARDGNWGVNTARAVIKRFFCLGLSLGETGDRKPRREDGALPETVDSGAAAAGAAAAPGETVTELCTFNSEGFKSVARQFLPSKRIELVADGDIDADGAYRAYHPTSGKGLDHLANAGGPGNWWGIVTDRDGKPFIQGPTDPAPGHYVSATSYEWPEFPKNDPRRYVDSETVPFIVVQSWIRNRAKGVVLGARARVTNLRTGKTVDCVVADMGPLKKIGELSIAAANAVGISGNPRSGGVDKPILKYEIWPDEPGVVNGVTYRLVRAAA